MLQLPSIGANDAVKALPDIWHSRQKSQRIPDMEISQGLAVCAMWVEQGRGKLCAALI